MEYSHLTIFALAVVSMVLGALWYGPIFGKRWMEIIGATDMDMDERRKMQKSAGPLYLITFVLVLFQLYALDYLISAISGVSALWLAICLWAAFVIPTVALGAMWNNDSRRISWARFLIQAGYYLILFIIFGLVLGK